MQYAHRFPTHAIVCIWFLLHNRHILIIWQLICCTKDNYSCSYQFISTFNSSATVCAILFAKLLLISSFRPGHSFTITCGLFSPPQSNEIYHYQLIPKWIRCLPRVAIVTSWPAVKSSLTICIPKILFHQWLKYSLLCLLVSIFHHFQTPFSPVPNRSTYLLLSAKFLHPVATNPEPWLAYIPLCKPIVIRFESSKAIHSSGFSFNISQAFM